jgi:hypothetical protein
MTRLPRAHSLGMPMRAALCRYEEVAPADDGYMDVPAAAFDDGDAGYMEVPGDVVGDGDAGYMDVPGATSVDDNGGYMDVPGASVDTDGSGYMDVPAATFDETFGMVSGAAHYDNDTFDESFGQPNGAMDVYDDGATEGLYDDTPASAESSRPSTAETTFGEGLYDTPDRVTEGEQGWSLSSY